MRSTTSLVPFINPLAGFMLRSSIMMTPGLSLRLWGGRQPLLKVFNTSGGNRSAPSASSSGSSAL